MNKIKYAATAIIIAIVLCTGPAQGVEIDWPEPNWPEIFEPNQLLKFYLTMDPCDWQAILHTHPGEGGPAPDCIYDPCEYPAWFWMDGEEALKIRVAVRRKKGFAFPDEVNPQKVALKIDINQYYGNDPGDDPNAATEWHGLKKLSLEVNIDSMDVISEGVACNIHRMASGPEGYGYDSWYGNWVELYVNGNYIGIYANVEQRDKQFMKHRDLYVSHDSWLYKYADCELGFVLRVGDDDFPKSPAVEALCYDPFVHRDDPNLRSTEWGCAIPGYRSLALQLSELINMQGMLTMAAVDAFLANSDPLFESSNNTYFLDFNQLDPCETRKRMYFPWDVDGSFKDTTWDMYYTGSSETYDEIILGNPVFRAQYNQIIRDLLAGPLTFADINDFLDMVEPVITSAVEADPLAMDHIFVRWGASSAAEYFDMLRSFFSQRIPNVLSQVDMDAPLPPLLPPGIILLEDGFEGAVWDANWNDIAHNWLKDIFNYGPSAWADEDNKGDLTCDALDTNDATAIHIDFWCMKDDTETTDDFRLFYYNGASYVDVCDLDTLGADDEWLHYTDTITDNQYFVPNFRIRFNATPDSKKNENVWVDDVVITKETLCTKANLDCVDPVNFDDFVILGNDWALTGIGLAGDIDGNDVVNFGDLDWLVDYWLSDCGQP